MRRALLALVVVAAGIASTSAATLTNTHTSSDDLVEEMAVGMKPQPRAELIKTAVPASVTVSSGQSGSQGKGNKGSGGQSLDIVLATLALIGAIAVRRYHAGKS